MKKDKNGTEIDNQRKGMEKKQLKILHATCL